MQDLTDVLTLSMFVQSLTLLRFAEELQSEHLMLDKHLWSVAILFVSRPVGAGRSKSVTAKQ